MGSSAAGLSVRATAWMRAAAKTQAKPAGEGFPVFLVFAKFHLRAGYMPCLL